MSDKRTEFEELTSFSRAATWLFSEQISDTDGLNFDTHMKPNVLISRDSHLTDTYR